MNRNYWSLKSKMIISKLVRIVNDIENYFELITIVGFE